MEQGLFVSLSAQISRIERLETIASNLANSQTVGFRGTEIKFEEVLDEATGQTSFASDGVEYLDGSSGALEQTGNPLDFAIRGDAWFGVQTSAGFAVTRDGRFKMSPIGELLTLSGNPVLDPGGAPIALNPAGGPPELGSDGFIRQGGRQVGALGLFSYTATPNFSRYGDSGILVEGDPEPLVDNGDVGIIQGHVENSNVNSLHEIVSLIDVQRTFEQAASIMKTSEDSLQQLIRALNGG
jgi:flagellar basal-body rod protein FlgF